MFSKKTVDLLSNFDILYMCKQLQIPLIDVLPKDKLNEIEPKQGCYVINMADSYDNNGGTHWVCLYMDSHYCIYYDSFGLRPPEDVKRFVYRYDFHKSMNGIIFNTTQQQAYESVLCGYYCVYFLYWFTVVESKNTDVYDILDGYVSLFMPNNFKMNDKILQKLIKNLVIDKNLI